MNAEQHEHPPEDGDRANEPPAGSGTVAKDSREKRHAGSYSRDAEQDPDAAPDSTTS
jgi:hypothetical protein